MNSPVEFSNVTSLPDEPAHAAEPFRWGRLLVLAVVLTAAACSAALLVEDERLQQLIDGTHTDATPSPVRSSA
jgi:hypothetical protein